MNIGFFTDGYLPQLNGVATNVDAAAGALERQGHRVTIFAPDMGGWRDERPVYRFRSFKAVQDPPLWLAAPISLRLPRLARLDLDIVHVHSPFSMQALGWQVARLSNVPLVSTYHTLLPAQVHHVRIFGRQIFPASAAEKYSAWTCNVCDHIVAPSEKVKELLLKYGVRRPFKVIPNGVEVNRFGHGPRGFVRERFGLTADAKLILSVGRLTPDKNFAFLIEVLTLLVKRYDDAYLVLVGQGPLKAEFEALASEAGVRRNLVLTGPIPPARMPEIYADADLYTTASFSEVHSLAAIEALAAGLPMVAVPDQSFQVMITDGENGFIAPANTEIFADRIGEILSDPLKRERMSARSLARSQDFSVDAQARHLVQLYETLTERHAAKTRFLPRPWPLRQRIRA